MSLNPRIAWLLCCLATACTGSDTGNPRMGAEKEPCPSVREDLVPVGSKTELGFSALEVLGGAQLSHTEPLTWLSGTESSYEPGASSESLTLDIRISADEARYMHRESRSQDLECPDELAIPVTVVLNTSSGALAESFDATLVTSGGTATLSHTLPAAALGGSLKVTKGPEGHPVTAFNISIEVSAERSWGQIFAVSNVSGLVGDDGVTSDETLGVWGQRPK